MIFEHMKTVWEKVRRVIIPMLLIALLYAVMLLAVGWTCPIKALLGISCPGCGMTRACISAVRLDFVSAFSYHPLWVVLLPYIAVLLVLVVKEKRKVTRIWLLLGAFLMLIVYGVRMAWQIGDVVVFEPQNGWIARSIGAILDGISK